MQQEGIATESHPAHKVLRGSSQGLSSSPVVLKYHLLSCKSLTRASSVATRCSSSVALNLLACADFCTFKSATPF